MFGWLKGKPRCPVGPTVKAWLEGRVAWIVREFGIERMREEMVLPNDDFFPGEYNGTEDDARRLFEQVCEYMDVSASRVELRFYRVSDPHARSPFSESWARSAGLYQERDGRAVIQVEESQLSDTLSLVATIAHELAHVHLLGDRRLQKNEDDGERVTDLLAVFLGFGVFTANSASRANVFLGLVEGRSGGTRGYLSDDEFAYALAILAWLRNEHKPSWARLLRPNVREPMLGALRWLAEADENTQLPRGHRFDDLGQQAETIPLSPYPRLTDFAAQTMPQEEEPSDLDYVGQGVFDRMAGRFSDAIRNLTAAIEDNPDDVEAHQQRALTYIELNQPEKALADGQKAVALAPEDVESYFVRGKALMLNSFHDLAVADFDVVIDDNDDKGEGNYRLAESLHQRGLARAIQGDAAAAVNDFSRAIVKVPYRPEFYEARAAAYDFLGETRKAQRDREEAEWRRAKPPS